MVFSHDQNQTLVSTRLLQGWTNWKRKRRQVMHDRQGSSCMTCTSRKIISWAPQPTTYDCYGVFSNAFRSPTTDHSCWESYSTLTTLSVYSIGILSMPSNLRQCMQSAAVRLKHAGFHLNSRVKCLFMEHVDQTGAGNDPYEEENLKIYSQMQEEAENQTTILCQLCKRENNSSSDS